MYCVFILRHPVHSDDALSVTSVNFNHGDHNDIHGGDHVSDQDGDHDGVHGGVHGADQGGDKECNKCADEATENIMIVMILYSLNIVGKVL